MDRYIGTYTHTYIKAGLLKQRPEGCIRESAKKTERNREGVTDEGGN